MDPKHFEIKEYMIIWRQLEIQNFNGITAKVRAIVRCTGGDYAMDVFFLSEDSAYPDPFVNDKEKKGYMFLNIRDITWADQGKLNRFVETNDKAYDVIRDTAKALKLDLSKMK